MSLPQSADNPPSYVNSHQAPGKGDAYDTYYSLEPEMRYLWQQERRVLADILRVFYPEQPVHLLDFACGTGRITSFLESQVASSCGVDVSQAMLEVASKKLTRTRLLKMDLIAQCPFPKASFNLITAFRFFLNAEPELRRAAVHALAPLLAPGGCFVFNIHQNSHSLYYWPVRLYCRLRQRECDRTLSVGECGRLLKPVGLRIARVYPVGLLHLPRLRFFDETRAWMDGKAMRSNALGRLSDSPIVVARPWQQT